MQSGAGRMGISTTGPQRAGGWVVGVMLGGGQELPSVGLEQTTACWPSPATICLASLLLTQGQAPCSVSLSLPGGGTCRVSDL